VAQGIGPEFKPQYPKKKINSVLYWASDLHNQNKYLYGHYPFSC
jgi:hypothetical protein